MTGGWPDDQAIGFIAPAVAEQMLKVTDFITIPDEELHFTASLSSGPGGQHVNRVHTRITLWFDVAHSPSLSPAQKELLIRRLGGRMSKDGVLRVISQQTRSQAANREDATDRLVSLLQTVLREAKPRKKTRISRSAHLRRLDEKRHRSLLKRRRSAAAVRPPGGDEID